MAILEINDYLKTFGTFSLGPMNLSIEAGCALGLVGANGAGKTTLFRTLVGAVRKDSGQIQVDGKQVTEASSLWKQNVGYVGDYTPLFDHWDGHKNLQVFSRFYPAYSEELALNLVQRLNLDLTKKVRTYSTGQRTKFAIVLALSHKPQLLLLDEPSNGLDPVAREAFMEVLFEYMESGNASLIYATHHISEIENLADRLVFVSNGLVVGDEIKEDLTERWRRLTFRHEHALENVPHILDHKSEHPFYELVSDDVNQTLQHLQSCGVEGVEATRLSVEQITVQILRKSAREISHV